MCSKCVIKKYRYWKLFRQNCFPRVNKAETKKLKQKRGITIDNYKNNCSHERQQACVNAGSIANW